MGYEFDKIPFPKSIPEVPEYLKTLLGSFFGRFFYILKLVWQTGRWILLLMTFMAVFQGVTPVIGTVITKNILNELQLSVVSGSGTRAEFLASNIFALTVFLFVYRTLVSIIKTAANALTRVAGEKVVRQVRLMIMNKSKEIDMASFDDPEFYEKMENAEREAGSRPLNVVSQTFNIVSTLIEFLSYVAILAAAPGLSWMTALILAVSIPSAIINFIYRKKNFNYMRRRSKERREMNYYSTMLTDKDNVKEVRMFGLADTFIDKFKEVFVTYYKGLRRLIVGESAWYAVIAIISGATNMAFYLIVTSQVFSGRIMIGDFTLYTSAITTLAACVSSLISTSASVYEGTLFIDNLITYMEQKPTVTAICEVPAPVRRGGHTIELKNVSFRYPGASRDVLHDVNMTINEGDTVVLVGLNGAGKTTLIKLITRLYDPTDGVILLDGRDIREYDTKELYKLYGIIFQDFGRYAVSVKDNIRFGDISKETDDETIERAAKMSGFDSYVKNLKNGYDTPLTRLFEKNGAELSTGQWQKLAVSRAFYSDSDILILDEPTASLDAIAEQEIFRQFDELRRDKTTIFVSHRLSSASSANKIVVLENGTISESGSYEELMKLHGTFYELFMTQAERYIAGSSAAVTA